MQDDGVNECINSIGWIGTVDERQRTSILLLLTHTLPTSEERTHGKGKTWNFLSTALHSIAPPWACTASRREPYIYIYKIGKDKTRQEAEEEKGKGDYKPTTFDVVICVVVCVYVCIV
jgi:hypothetical protein